MNKKAAAEFLGRGMRSLERYTSEGRLTPQKVRTKTGPALDYSEEDLARLRSELEIEQGVILDAPPPSPPRAASTAKESPSASLAIASRQSEQRLAKASPPASQGSQRPAKASPDLVQVRSKLVFTIDEAAALTGFSQKRIRDAITSGELNAVRVGRPWQILPEDLVAWVYGLFKKAPPALE